MGSEQETKMADDGESRRPLLQTAASIRTRDRASEHDVGYSALHSEGTIAEFVHEDALGSAALELRAEFDGEPAALVPAFLERTFASFERSNAHQGRLLTQWQIADPGAKRSLADVQQAVERAWAEQMVSAAEQAKIEQLEATGELAVLAATGGLPPPESTLDDTILVVFISPSDDDDYVALGGKRLYWFDDDRTVSVKTVDEDGALNTVKRPVLSHVLYHADLAASDGEEGLGRTTDAEGPTSLPLRALDAYAFELDAQGYVVADGGGVDVHRLPYRPRRDPGHIEASRVCVLLNALRELLHPDTAHLKATSLAGTGRHRSDTLHAASGADETPIDPAVREMHLARARAHGANSKVLDEDGDTPDLFTPLDAPPPYGLKYRFGAGITLYLKLQSIMFCGFCLAALLAVPTLLSNGRGGVLTSIGLGALGTTFSLGNRLPHAVTFWPTQFLDVAYSLVLMFAFSALRRAISRVEEAVDDGAATAADYTLYVHRVPAHLGARPDGHAAAVDVYRHFFRHLCEKPPRTARDRRWWLFGADVEAGEAPRPPADPEISEMVFIKNNGSWLTKREAYKKSRAAARYAALGEARPAAGGGVRGPPQWPAFLGGGEVSLAAQGYGAGLVLGYSAAYHEAQAAKALEAMRALDAEGEDGEEAQVVALLVSFNSTDALDKVQYELVSTSLIGQARALLFYFLRPFEGTCVGRLIDLLLTPLLALVGDSEKFEHDDGEGNTVATRVIVERAVEPSDYIWENVSVSTKARMYHKFVGWATMLLSIGAAVAMTVALTASFGATPPASGVFTYTDQRCLDVAFLRTPGAAAHCGLPAAAAGADGAAAPWLDELAPRAGADAAACADGEACGYAARMGELVGAARCTTHTTNAFSSYAQWAAELARERSGDGLVVSDAAGTLLPECAFLGSPSADGRGYSLVVEEATTGLLGQPEVRRDAYCGFALNTSALPYTLAAPFRCRADFGAAGAALDAARTDEAREAARKALGRAPALTKEAGLADVLRATSCDDTNCILCVERYQACQQASAALATQGQLLDAASQRTLSSTLSGLTISVVNTLLSYLAKALANRDRPISQSHLARSLMEKTFLLYAGSTLCSLLLLNLDTLGHLGFYLQAGAQVYSLLISYGAIKLLTIWSVPPLTWLLNRFVLAPRALTQAKMNSYLEGYAFDYARSTAYTLFLIFISAFFSTVLPLSLPICAASLLLRYLTERVYFLRVYKRPPRYDASLVRSAAAMLPIAIVGKLATMYYFYQGTRAGELGVYVLLATAVVWLTLSSKAMRALLLPCCLAHPIGPWKWVADVEGTSQERDVAATVTHQTLRARRQMERYAPLGPATPGLAGGGAPAARDSFAEAPPELAKQPSVHQASAFRPFTWINPDALPEAVRCPNSGEDHALAVGAVGATHDSEQWGLCEWRRAARLPAAEGVETFATWAQAKHFIETRLRRPVGAGEPIGPCADGPLAHEGARFVYTGVPVALLAPARRWAMLDAADAADAAADAEAGGDDAEAGGDDGDAPAGRWVLAYTRDRAEAPQLQWRLVEAASREGPSSMLRRPPLC